MIGALSQACSLPVTTAVTCPTIRIHPAIVAQAAATAAVRCTGRFLLGVGTGEALNEHVLGDPWPSEDVRLDMLEEAVELMRQLWSGEVVTPPRRHYAIDTARVYTLPDEPPPIYVSAFGPKALDVAARIGDGFINTTPTPSSSQTFKEKSGGKPCHRRREGRLGGDRGRGRRPRPPALGQLRASGRALAGAAQPEALRAGLAAGHPRLDGRERRGRQRHRPSTSTSSAPTSKQATTRSTSPTWARTTSTMIESYGSDVFPQLRG